MFGTYFENGGQKDIEEVIPTGHRSYISKKLEAGLTDDCHSCGRERSMPGRSRTGK